MMKHPSIVLATLAILALTAGTSLAASYPRTSRSLQSTSRARYHASPSHYGYRGYYDGHHQSLPDYRLRRFNYRPEYFYGNARPYYSHGGVYFSGPRISVGIQF